MVGDIEFVTDGSYRCPVTNGRYSIRPFKNPSGELVPRLSGYRPSPGPRDSQLPGDGKAPKNGARIRKNDFDTLKEADAERDRLILEDENTEKRFHLIQTTLLEEEVRDAEAAKIMMSDLPPPDWTNGKWTYKQLVKFVAEKYVPCRNPKSLAEAIKEFNQAEKASNLKYATRDGKSSHLNRLIRKCPSGILVHEVPVEVLKALIHSGKKKKTWKKNKSNFNTFFEWAADEERGYCPCNPVKSISLAKKKDDYKPPVILNNDQVLDILTKAQSFKGGCLFLFCVIAIVVALRPSELARIQALRKVLGIESFRFGEEPDEKDIHVIGKTRQLRNAVIPPEFVDLIKVYVDAGYPVIPRNFALNWTLLRAMAGFLGRRDLLPRHLFSEDLEEWTKDVLRHVGITHHLNRTQDEKATALWAGDSPAIIFFHYKGKSTRKQTRQFYKIAKRLKLPTVEELKAAGVPEGASESELKRLKCPVDEPNTFFMDQKQFDKARKAYIARCPEAAIPEANGPRRGKGMWTKRRMLDLPKERTEQIRLLWTTTIEELSRKHDVARSTIALALEEFNLPPELYPPKGFWQIRAAGKSVLLPEEVQKVFPNGLPPMTAPVGRQISLEWPSLAKFFRMLWEKPAAEIAIELKCSKSSVERRIRFLKLPRPDALYWLARPEQRYIPAKIKGLLVLDSEALQAAIPPGGFDPQDLRD